MTNADYLTPYRGTAPPTGLKVSPFQAFVTAYNGSPDNEPHTLIERRNGDWIADELNNITNTPRSCIDFCGSGPAISGPANLCSSAGIYSVAIGSAPASTVCWSVSPAGILSNPNPQCGTSSSVTPIGNGSVTITAKIDNISCSPASILISKTVFVGRPVITQPPNTMAYITSTPPNYTYNSVCPLVTTVVNLQVDGASSTSWEKVTTTFNSSWYADGNNLDFYFFSANQTAVFKFTASNACGSTVLYFAFQSIDCGSDPCGGTLATYSISPNPASESITIVPNVPPPCGTSQPSTLETASRLPSVSAAKSLKKSKPVIKQVCIYDGYGKLVKKTMLPEGVAQTSIQIGNLPNGVYFVEIIGTNTKDRKKLVIARQ